MSETKGAVKRLANTIKAGFVTYAMLYRDEAGNMDPEWRRFQRVWLLTEIVGQKLREVGASGKTLL